ncbi:sigma-70 family RNA polymerase sigma factor [Nocardioides conyzicola]|uniref:Sigma-70 family RNA polymerase sigma factor n=1 Tax=Nocardioides conyzicola TaxID=1651781 RepID=A0ABP8Y0I5_9ACTN
MSAPSLQIPTSTDAGESGAGETVDAALDAALEIFLSERTRLFRIAHRVTGDQMSAEDVVQEAWLRWQRTDRRVIKNPAAFLTTTTTHLAINVIQSARHRHETFAEPPLAELADPEQDPTAHAEQTCAVEETLLVLMSRLSPAELAAYLLRKGFEYPYVAIATLLRTTSANARQLVRRAQQRVDGDRVRTVDADAHRQLVAAFLTAARTGDRQTLEGILGHDARPTTRTHQRPPVRPGHPPARPRLA